MKKAALFLLVLLGPVVCRAKTIYVDADAPGANNGSSWADTYRFLQDALADANSSAKPVEIRVADGTYRPDEDSLHPDGTGSREATFQLINGVTLKGGYAGLGQPDPNARDVELYKTILSGDRDGNDVDYNDQWWYFWKDPARDENSYHIVTGSGTDQTAVLDGFIITGGSASEIGVPIYGDGGGVYCTYGSPTISNCNIVRNFACRSGAGIYNSYGANPTITSCTFSQNAVYNKGYYPVNGAGMYNELSSPIIHDCLFIDNIAYSGDEPYTWVNGGGIYNLQSNPIIAKCTFTRNQTWYGYGGGIYNFCSSNPLITDCSFTEGHAEWGGGIACNENSSPTIKNCIISGNLTYQDGGGIYCMDSAPVISNCLVVSNESEEGLGGGISCISSSPTVKNCIVLGNVYRNITLDGDSAPLITYCNIDFDGEGNINADPCFADSTNADYHLKSQAGRWDANDGLWVVDDVTSPCIDAGDPMSAIGHEPFPNGGIINMGAYGGTPEASKSYFGKQPCETIVAGDINGDCIVDFRDLCIMALYWCEDNNP